LTAQARSAIHVRMRLPSLALPVLVSLVPLVVACGGGEKGPASPKPESSNDSGDVAVKKDRPAIVYDLGDVAPDVARRNFEKLGAAWNACYEKGHGANAALGGTLTFSLRTNHDGSVKWVFVKESDLGDRVVERCVLEAVRNMSWGEPVDAKEGEIRGKTVGWKNEEDEPVEVGAERVTPAIEKAKAKLAACRKDAGANGKIRATFYVGPKGKPLSIGFAVDDAAGESAADCLHGVLMGLAYANASQQIVKTTVEIP
jgi:hypothetical protein